jgi:protein-S-isoprenylcysteine O-methyltransferase Ste14
LRIGELFYKYRGYTPVPFFVAAIVLSNPRDDLMIFGAILMAFGELLRVISVSYLGVASRAREIVAEKLITNGPYAFIRNPMYTGNMFLYMGASIYAGGWLPFMLYLVILFFSVQYSLMVKYEESGLEDLHGDEFRNYIETVPRFYPRLTPYPQKSKKKLELATVLSSEKTTFLAIIGFIILVQVVFYLKS